MVPLDVVKCRIQVSLTHTRAHTHTELYFVIVLYFFVKVNPTKYVNTKTGFKLTVREDGLRGLARGWAPTLVGYSLQGMCKFGFYEVFKILYWNALGEVSPHTQQHTLGDALVFSDR